LGGKEEFAAAIGAVLFQQADANASKAKPLTAALAAGSPWKMVGRAGLGGGAGKW